MIGIPDTISPTIIALRRMNRRIPPSPRSATPRSLAHAGRCLQAKTALSEGIIAERSREADSSHAISRFMRNGLRRGYGGAGRPEVIYCVEKATWGSPFTDQVVRHLIPPWTSSHPLQGMPGRDDQGQPLFLRAYSIGRGVRWNASGRPWPVPACVTYPCPRAQRPGPRKSCAWPQEIQGSR